MRCSFHENVHAAGRADGNHPGVDAPGVRARGAELEALRQHAQHDSRLQQRQVLPQTVARPLNEGQKCVGVNLRRVLQEALCPKRVRLGPDVGAVVHALDGKDDARARGNEARAKRVIALSRARGFSEAMAARPADARTTATRVTTGTTEYRRRTSFRVASV